jgi:hypothetical protein
MEPFDNSLHRSPDLIGRAVLSGTISSDAITDVEKGRIVTECVSLEQFERFVMIREGLPEVSKLMLDRLSVNEYLQQQARLFLTHDGKGGFGIIGTELVSLFSYPEARHGERLMRIAIAEGATFLSCFDIGGFLPRFYERFGFQEVARYLFDGDLAPSNWLYDQLGTPDVIQMSRL